MAEFAPTGLRVLARSRRSVPSPPRPWRSATRSPRCRGRWRPSSRPRAAAVRTTSRWRRAHPGGSAAAASAIRVLDELDAAVRDVAGGESAGPVRLGAFATATAGLVPAALATLPRDLKVSVREGTTPTLTRALRAGHARPRGHRPRPALPAAGRRVTRAGAHDAVRARADGRGRGEPPVCACPRRRGRRARGAGVGRERRATTPCSGCGPASRNDPTSATWCATGWPSSRSSRRGWPSRRLPRSWPGCSPTGSRPSPYVVSRRRCGESPWPAVPGSSTAPRPASPTHWTFCDPR